MKQKKMVKSREKLLEDCMRNNVELREVASFWQNDSKKSMAEQFRVELLAGRYSEECEDLKSTNRILIFTIGLLVLATGVFVIAMV